MPEIIQSPAHDHPFAGKGHDFPDHCPVFLAVTVNTAVLARWFRVERAVAAFQQGLVKEGTTAKAERNPCPERLRQLRGKRDRCSSVPGLTVNPNEIGQDLEVLRLCAGKSFHGSYSSGIR